MSKRSGCLMAVAAVALVAGNAARAAVSGLKILHHEEVELTKRGSSGSAERVSFDAYGRRFELILERNETLLQELPPDSVRGEPLRGVIEGLPGSWVRLTRDGNRWIGMLFDGRELYAIEPTVDVANSVVQPLAKSGSAPVIYRLSDALLPTGPGFCGAVSAASSDDSGPTALEVYESVASELRAQAMHALPSKQLRLGVVADFEFASKFEAPEQQIVTRMNMVDGIFSSQLGVRISLAPFTIHTQSNDPFTESNAEDLLKEVWTYRRNSPQQLALGATHLMSGRNLDGDIVGIAYIGALCDHTAASLSEAARPATMAALVIAHELGHNFNAPHDGEPGACEQTPQTFLMAPKLNGSNQFSACSISQIQPRIATAQCLIPFVPPDVRMEAQASDIHATVDTPFALTFRVQALGGEPSENIVTTAVLPGGFTVDFAAAAYGSCTSGAGTVSCDLGMLQAGEARTVTLSLMAREAGSFVINLSAASDNDSIPDNNAAQVAVTVSGASPPQPPPTQNSSTGGGGGGRVDALLVLFLLSRLLFGLAHRAATPAR